MTWTVRSLKPTDGMGFSSQIHAIQEAGWTQDQIRSSLTGPTARIRVATDPSRDQDSIQGFLLARRIADILEIDLVTVIESRRRLGIARLLLSELIEEESRFGLCEARLELASSNAAARALYAGLSFVVVGRRKRYYPDGDDALQLSRWTLSAVP